MSCICSPTLCTKNTGRRSLLRAVESGTLAFRGSNDELSSWEDAVKSISGRGQSACKAVCKCMVVRGLESVTERARLAGVNWGGAIQAGGQSQARRSTVRLCAKEVLF